jgi:hypothetical protein
MGTSQRQGMSVSKSIQEMPGPANYGDGGHSFGKTAQAFSIKGKVKEQQRLNSPGPGAYEFVDKQTKANKEKAYKFGSSQRQSVMNKSCMEMPGPGSTLLDLNTFGGKGVHVTIQTSRKEQRKDEKPGPGQYDHFNDLNTKTKSMTAKFGKSSRGDILNIKSAAQLPGPGNYTITEEHEGAGGSLTRYKGPSYTFSGKHQQSSTLTPGPGQYDMSETEMLKYKAQTVRFAQSKRETSLLSKSVIELPGPGKYGELDAFGKNATAASIRGKRQEQKPNGHPGPGTYEDLSHAVKEKAVSFRMGSAKRSGLVDRNAEKMPGPAEYNGDEVKGFGKAGPRFTFNSRQPRLDHTLSPGPGAYDNPESALVRPGTHSVRMG